MQEGKSTVIDCTTGKCQCQKFHISFLPTLTCTYDIIRFGKRLNSLSVLLLRDGIILIATKNFWGNTAENQTIRRQLTLAWITKITTRCLLSQMQSSSVAIHQTSAGASGTTQTVCCLAWGPVGMRLGHPCFTWLNCNYTVCMRSGRVTMCQEIDLLSCLDRHHDWHMIFFFKPLFALKKTLEVSNRLMTSRFLDSTFTRKWPAMFL